MIALIVAVVVGAAAVFSYSQTPTYQAAVKILVGHEVQQTSTVTEQERESLKEGIPEFQNATNTTSTFTPPGLNTELQGLQELTKTIATAVKTRPVAEEVASRLENLDVPVSSEDVLQNMEAKQTGGETLLVNISYRDSDPERTKLIADTIGDAFTDQISTLSPSSASHTTATVWERAKIPDDPATPNPERNVLLALMVGLMLGVGLALLLEHLNDDWRSPEEAEQVSGVPTLAAIPAFMVRPHDSAGASELFCGW
jgi:capsular polysaccharide biosynthesis protein